MSTHHDSTHYDVLKVAHDAPDAVIRAAYRVLAARHHPDRCAGDAGALRRMQRINEAWRVLSDPVLRAAYDTALQRQRRRRASDDRRDGASALSWPAPEAVGAVALRRRAAAAYASHAGPAWRGVV